jgi:hypothetical protein
LACAIFCASRGAQHHIRVGPVLGIEEWIAPDRDRRIGLGDLAELQLWGGGTKKKLLPQFPNAAAVAKILTYARNEV